MTRFSLKSQSGMTLLEVLVSMIILSVSLLMLLNMAMVALDGNHWSNNTTLATQLMQQKLEEIRGAQDFSSGAQTIDGVDLSWTVSPIGAHLRRVDISAAWRRMDGDTHTSEITAFIKSDSV